ncbi:hypothetical protein HN51_042061 [Arachis hypogaea]|uniref:Tudor domain-containing protein n=3 Tax=Arachis TaxID=3817 RepID=A0A444YVA0_ARAHY|nr:sister chromatid cohesion protein PDS5 homolog C [Arachis duranensis]XP_025606573.1 microtubule-associated protein futsch [Arachis hypogaea]QHN87922.1 Sister chromatid cohesion protein [Arachis hypogaea]RYR05857.1 hypothetical protein Ahy_B06g085684 [Arachis hypogaea]
MASAERQLEEQLREAGNKLLDPPSSVDELLPLLDQVENCLSRVEQSPSQSTQNALSPALKALIADKLFKHSDVDVKVAVASCISEITRITAPDAPYDDDQMKEVFQLIVSSFESLHDMASRSYTKRTSILETVAKVRSCVVMLDLECDTLIVEMFKHFLKAVREEHPENVFSSMETIMTLVIEESEDIPLELLSPILGSVKKDNEEVLPIARKLGERVLECSASKLKPSLVQAVNTLGISLDNYSNVLASICQDTPGSMEQNDACATSEHVEGESKSTKEPVEESAQVAGEDAKEAEPPQQDSSITGRSPKSVMSNGIAQAGEEDALVDSKSAKTEDDTNCSNQTKGIDMPGKEEPNDLDAGKPDKSEKKLVQATKRRGRKTNPSVRSAEPSEGSHLAVEKEAGKQTDSKSDRKEVPSSPQQDGCVEAAEPSENDKETDTKVPSPKTTEGEPDIASPLPSENKDENDSKKHVRSKKKDSSAKEVTIKEVATDDGLKKVDEGTSDSEAKPSRRSGKKIIDRSSDGKKTTVADSDKKGSGISDADAKKQSAKKLEESKKGSVGSSSRQSEVKKKRAPGKVNSDKGIAKSATKDEEKELVLSPKSASKSTKDDHPEETPKTSAKRKRTPAKENESNIKDGEGLVGTRVKVFWPDDDMYYEGVVDSFDRSKKKHKVLYDDGDMEILNLKKERWEILDTAAPDGDEGSEHISPDVSDDNDILPEPTKKKGKTSDGKKAASSKSGGATSSKSKGSSGKSSQKSKDSSKVDRKTKENTPKTGGGKSIDAAPKASGKSKNTDGSKISKPKDDDVSASKPSTKSKQETPKTGKSKQETSKSAASKSKSSKSGGKSNGTGKMKASLLQVKDSESEDSEGSTKEMEEVKVKATSSSKSGTEVKTGKKRGRN